LADHVGLELMIGPIFHSHLPSHVKDACQVPCLEVYWSTPARQGATGHPDLADLNERYAQLKVAVIVPARNEEIPLPGVIAEVPSQNTDLVIVVDNGSTDRTSEVAQQAGAVVVPEPRAGYGYACAAGVRTATDLGAEVLVFLDADGSFDPAQIADLVSPIEARQASLVLGSRPTGGMEPGAMPPHARFGNWLVARLMRLLYGLRVTDLGPYRAIRMDLLSRLKMREMTYGWPTEMMVKAARLDARVVEVPVRYRVRRGGRSKVSGTVRGTILATYYILFVTLRYAFRWKGAS
jgi:glycosyltransferase involved in cell wall biosynthesis